MKEKEILKTALETLREEYQKKNVEVSSFRFLKFKLNNLLEMVDNLENETSIR